MLDHNYHNNYIYNYRTSSDQSYPSKNKLKCPPDNKQNDPNLTKHVKTCHPSPILEDGVLFTDWTLQDWLLGLGTWLDNFETLLSAPS